MKNSGLLFILCIFASSMIYCMETKQIMIKEWKYGFAVDVSGNVLYYDYSHSSDEYILNCFMKSKKEISNIQGEIIRGKFIQIQSNTIRVDNGPKKLSSLVKGHQILKYKIENNAGYVSSDGRKWEKLQIKYLRETGEDDSRGYPIVYVYFKCGFFKGEYQLGFGF